MKALSWKLFLKMEGKKRGYSLTLKVLGFVLPFFFSIGRAFLPFAYVSTIPLPNVQNFLFLFLV